MAVYLRDSGRRETCDDAEEVSSRFYPLVALLIFSRDRENSTVFVADLPAGVTEEELVALFKDVSSFDLLHT